MIDAARGSRNAAALAILALSALLLTPFLFQRAIAKRRLVYTSSLDPARSAASEAMLALAREVGSIRGYLLTRDTSLITEYRAARLEQDAAMSQLENVTRVNAAMDAQARAFMTAAAEWNVNNDLFAAGTITPAEATKRLPDQQDKYTAALDAGHAIDRSIVASVDAIRLEVGALEHRWALASIGLSILAAAGAITVLLLMRTTDRQSTLARTDPLTGLYNRLGFGELAARELSRARRMSSATTLMSLDLDGFKQVNDQAGHAAGDDVLRSVGRAIRGAIRDIDVAARLGGDEFAVLLPDNRAQPPERAVERVRAAITDALARERWPVTLSIGAVTVQQREIGIDEMIHISDKLMYAVKNNGKSAMKHELLGPSPAAV
jgi:diguanylate cyclase (GGDEF)-like protein